MAKTKQLTILALLTVVAAAVSMLESLIPLHYAIPGVKLGVSNIVILLVIYRFGARYGLAVTGLKSILVSVLFGGMSSFIYSFSGAICSGIAMGLVYRYKNVTPIGVSLLGAAVHISAQLVCAWMVLKSVYVFFYYPFVLLSSVVCGGLNGIVVKFIRKKYR